MTNPSLALSTGSAAVQPINAASITGLAIDNYKLPVSYQYSVGVQHALSTRTVLSVSYVGNQGRHQNDYRNINLPPQSELAALIGGAPYQTSGLTYPGFTAISLSQNEANTHFNSLQVDLNSQLSKDLTLRAFYTLARAVDPTTAGSGGGDLGSVSNPYQGWTYDEGLSGYNRTHVAVVDFIYDIPLFRHSENRLMKSVVGGWEVSGIVTLESGLPLDIGISENGRATMACPLLRIDPTSLEPLLILRAPLPARQSATSRFSTLAHRPFHCRLSALGALSATTPSRDLAATTGTSLCSRASS